MALHIWCLLASVLLASVEADIYDQGPQMFFESSSPAPQSEASAIRDFFLYLTPSQAKALEYSGASVRPHLGPESEHAQNEESQVVEPQAVEEQREPQYGSENSEEDKKEDSDSELEEIFKILNQQKINEQLEQREVDQTAEKPHEIPAEEGKKYFTPTVAKKLGPAKSYSYVRFLHPSEEPQNINTKPYGAQQPSLHYFENTHGSAEVRDLKEVSESDNQEVNISSLLQHRKISTLILEHRDRLLKNEQELHNKLHKLQDYPWQNNQKYAIEIQKLRSNLEKQNALSKAEALAKPARVLIKEEISANQRRPVEVNHVEVEVPTPVIVRVPQPFEAKTPQQYDVSVVRQVPIPYVKTVNNEVQKPVPVEVEKWLPSTKNIYMKVNKPYLSEHIAPVESNREIPVEGPFHEPEKLTIVRHIWEQ